MLRPKLLRCRRTDARKDPHDKGWLTRHSDPTPCVRPNQFRELDHSYVPTRTQQTWMFAEAAGWLSWQVRVESSSGDSGIGC
jgi:hypothetical protein